MNFNSIYIIIYAILYQLKVAVGEDIVYNETTYIENNELWSSVDGWVSKGFNDNPLEFVDICTFVRVPSNDLRICKINLLVGESAMIKCPSSQTLHGIIQPSKPDHYFADLSYLNDETRIDDFYMEKIPFGFTSKRLDTIHNGETLLLTYEKYSGIKKNINFICELIDKESDHKTDYERLSMIVNISSDQYDGDSVEGVLEYQIPMFIGLRNNYLQWNKRNVNIEVEMLPLYTFNIHCYGNLDYRLHTIPGKLYNDQILIKTRDDSPSVFPFTRKYEEFNNYGEGGTITQLDKSGLYTKDNSIIAKGSEMELYLYSDPYSIVLPYEFSCTPLEEDLLPNIGNQTIKLKFPSYSHMPKCNRVDNSTGLVPTILSNDILYCLADIDKHPVVIVSGNDERFLYVTKGIERIFGKGIADFGSGNGIITIIGPSTRILKLKALHTVTSVEYDPNIPLHFWNYGYETSDERTNNIYNSTIINAIKKCEFNSVLYGYDHNVCVKVLKTTETLQINCDNVYPYDLTKAYIKSKDGSFSEKPLSEIAGGLKRFKAKQNSLLFYDISGSLVEDNNELFLSCDPLSSGLRGNERLVRILLGFEPIKIAKPPIPGKIRYISAITSDNITLIKCPVEEHAGSSLTYQLLPNSPYDVFYTIPDLEALGTSPKGPIGNAIGMTNFFISNKHSPDNKSHSVAINRPKNHINIESLNPQMFYVCMPTDSGDKNKATIIELSFRQNVEPMKICGKNYSHMYNDYISKNNVKCKYSFYTDSRSINKSDGKVEIIKPESAIHNEFLSDRFGMPKSIKYYANQALEDVNIIVHIIGKLDRHFDYPSYSLIMDKREILIKEPSENIENLSIESFINKHNKNINIKKHNTPIGMICPHYIRLDEGPSCYGISRHNKILHKPQIIENFFYPPEKNYKQSLWIIDYEKWREIRELNEDFEYVVCSCKDEDGNLTTTIEIRDEGSSKIASFSLCMGLLMILLM